MVNKFKIGNIVIGDDCEPVIITELGINHSGKLDKAIYLADVAIRSGAKIIKHQTHVVEDEMIDAAKKIIPGNSVWKKVKFKNWQTGYFRNQF